MERRHLAVLLTGPAVQHLAGLREEWDPAMARVVPPHVTLVYPEETADEARLAARAEAACARIAPFRLALRGVVAEGGGAGGVFVAVDDLDGTWAALRRDLLRPPMTPLPGVLPHATIVHPRTSRRGSQCLAALADHRFDGEVDVTEIVLTSTTPRSFTALRRFALRG